MVVFTYGRFGLWPFWTYPYLKPAFAFIGSEFCDGNFSNKSEDIIFNLALW